jgi:hypothetical protein
LGVGAFTRGTACAMHALTLPHSSSWPHSFVRPRGAFFRPDRGSFTAPRAGRVKAGPLGPPAGLGLDAVRARREARIVGLGGILMRPSP